MNVQYFVKNIGKLLFFVHSSVLFLVWKRISPYIYFDRTPTMLRIIAVCDGFSHFETAINEYQKRFGSRLQFLRVAPCKSR